MEDGKNKSLEVSEGDDVVKTLAAGEEGRLENVRTARIIDHSAKMKICWKMDIRILGNLGNAKTDGMDMDLRFVGNQYNVLLSVFFIPYVIFAFPITLAGKAIGASQMLPFLMFIFSAMTPISSACLNFGGMMALRWFLGMAEGAFLPLVIYYLTTFYRRGELARRLSIFYAASSIASAFSGLLAFSVFQI